jgi:hypothetical protein
LKRRVIFQLLILLVITMILVLPVKGAERLTVALIAINNYSGVDSVGGNKMEKLVAAEFVKTIKKENLLDLIDREKTAEIIEKNDLTSFYQAAGLCTSKDLNAIGNKLEVNQLLILEVNGYTEIKREKSKKSYQLLLGLRVFNCNDGTESTYSGEGFSDSERNTAFTNSVAQLINNYLNIGAGDQSIGSLRSSSIQVLGNKASKMYHLLNTNHNPKEVNQQIFSSRVEAEQNHYYPCPICFPSYKSFIYSDRELEESLGSEGCGTIEYYYRVEHNPQLQERLERVAAPLIKDSYRKNIDYRFRIIDSTEVNAFGVANGYIYVSKGLLDIVESDDELAFVIAHEMGHIEKKHAVKRYRTALTAALFASIFIAASNKNNDHNGTATLFAVVVTEIIMKGYSREQENEADDVAIAHLKHINYDYLAFKVLMGKFIDMRQQKIWAIDKVFSTHPTPEKRIENINKLLEAYDTLQLKLAVN